MEDREESGRGPYKRWREDPTREIPSSTRYRHKQQQQQQQGAAGQVGDDHAQLQYAEQEDNLADLPGSHSDDSMTDEVPLEQIQEQNVSLDVDVTTDLIDVGHEDSQESFVSSEGEEEGEEEEEQGEDEEEEEEEVNAPLQAGEQQYDEKFDKCLHQHTNFTLGNLLYRLGSMFLKHKFSKSCLVDILQLISEIVPNPHNVPSTKYKFFKLIFELSPNKGVHKKHYLCGNGKCQQYFGLIDDVPNTCNVCGSNTKSMFIENDVGDILKYFFEKADLASIIDQKSKEVVNDLYIKDICDGKKYKELNRNKYDITTISHTDGAPMSESSKLQVWPIYSMPVEVPVKLRSRYIILAGIWCGMDKPNMNTYLLPFAQSNFQLCTQGISWTHPETKIVHVSKVFAALYSVDAQARAPMQNISLYNALNGCGACEQESITVPVGRGHASVYRYLDSPASERTNEKMLEQADSGTSEIPVKGVKGPSCLSLIPCVDIADGFVPEYLHSLCLGNTRHFLYAMLDSKNKGKPFYLGDSVAQIDAKLLSITPTSMIKRLPRSVLECKHWKGAEYRSWLLYYSLYCLEGVWPNTYQQHWMLLVNGTYLLLKEKILENEVKLAMVLFNMFCKDVETLYGVEHMTYNMHQLLHLGKSVLNWGPLSVTSVFPFENETGNMKLLGHGTSNLATELANSMELVNSLKVMRLFFVEKRDNVKCTVTDKKLDKNTLNQDVIRFLETCEEATPNYSVHNRAVKGNIVLTSVKYDRSKKTSNKVVQFKVDDTYKLGKIITFIKPENSDICLAVVQIITEQEPHFVHRRTGIKISHIFPYVATNELELIKLSSIQHPIIELGTFLCYPPNLIEINL